MISVQNLKKHYQVHKRPPGIGAALKAIFHREYTTVKAVDGINFHIQSGERVGFLGPNGAGKTTTLKMLSGLLHPTEGEVRVDEHIPQKRDVDFLKKVMLVMGQKQQLIWDLPPAETFELNRAIYDVSKADFKQRMDELITLLELEELINKPTRQLSLGERMKCELAAALVHAPKVLFLDEPTIGLDVSMQVVMREFIKHYNERHGATLILTSHYMDDVLALCPRIIVIDKGQLSFDGQLQDLVRQVRPEKRVTLRLSQNVDANAMERLAKVISLKPREAVLQVPSAELNRVVGEALANFPVSDLNVEDAPLEEVMSELFAKNRSKREADQAA